MNGTPRGWVMLMRDKRAVVPFTMNMPIGLRERLDAVTRRTGATLTACVIQALEEWLAEQEQEQETNK